MIERVQILIDKQPSLHQYLNVFKITLAAGKGEQARSVILNLALELFRELMVMKSALFKAVRGRLLSLLLREVDLLPVYNFAPVYQNAEEIP